VYEFNRRHILIILTELSELMSSKNIIKDKIYNIISDSLNIDVSIITDDLSVGSIPEWDSLAHVALIAAVEKEFGLQFEIDQVFELEEVEDFVEIVKEIIA